MKSLLTDQEKEIYSFIQRLNTIQKVRVKSFFLSEYANLFIENQQSKKEEAQVVYQGKSPLKQEEIIRAAKTGVQENEICEKGF